MKEKVGPALLIHQIHYFSSLSAGEGVCYVARVFILAMIPWLRIAAASLLLLNCSLWCRLSWT